MNDGDELPALFAGRSVESRRALARAWAGTTRSREMLPPPAKPQRPMPAPRLVRLTEHFADHRERPVWINPNRVTAVRPHIAPSAPHTWIHASGVNGVIGVREELDEVVAALTGTRTALEQSVITAARAWRATLSDAQPATEETLGGVLDEQRHNIAKAAERLVDAVVALDCDHPANDRVVTRDGATRCGQCGSLAEPVVSPDDDEQP